MDQHAWPSQLAQRGTTVTRGITGLPPEQTSNLQIISLLPHTPLHAQTPVLSVPIRVPMSGGVGLIWVYSILEVMLMTHPGWLGQVLTLML